MFKTEPNFCQKTAHLIVSLPADLSWPSIQWEGLLASTAEQHSSESGQCCHSAGAVARPGEPGPACPEPEGLLYLVGSCQRAGPLHSLSIAQDLPVALLHGPGWTSGLNFCTDEHHTWLFIIFSLYKWWKYWCWAAILAEGRRSQPTSAAHEPQSVQIQSRLQSRVWSTKQSQKEWDERD